jgi:hypothetical protein
VTDTAAQRAPLRLGSDFSRVPIHSGAPGAVPARPAIKQHGDGREQEASLVSGEVMRMPAPRLHRAAAGDRTRADGPEGRSEPLQLDGVPGDGVGRTVAPPIVHEVLRAPGKPLDAATRAFMEPRFGHDFSRVRVHSGPAAGQAARSVEADAYTVGHDVVFGDGCFMPATQEGGRLLAHELTHVVQQAGGPPRLQRAPTTKAVSPAPKLTEAEAEAWYREMNVDDAFADPSPPWADGDQVLSGKALEDAIEDSLHQSLTPEEMHRQLLVRRAQPLGATAYQAADPQAALADMQRKIRNLQAKIRTRNAKIAKLKKLGPTSKEEIDAAKAEIGAFEDEVNALKKARERLPSSSNFSRIGKGAPAGTGEITYAGIQIETADGKRIALEFAETSTTEHAEEAMIRSIESKLTKAQLRGARVTVVGDQVVCGERCVPALSQFAERNAIESVDGIVFQRTRINPPPLDFIGPQELASPRTTLRTMTESKSAGRELIRRQLPIYRAPAKLPSGSGGAANAAAASGVEHAVGTAAPAEVRATTAAGAEKKVLSGIEHAAAKEPRSAWSAMASNFAKELRSLTPAKVARLGKNVVVEGVKGYVTAKAVDLIIGDSRLEDDLAALDAANHAPHDNRAEKIRSYEKEAISFLPPQVAIIVAGALRTANPVSADFLYEATVQENQRRYEKFKEDYGDSDDANLLYQQSLKAEEDFYNGITPWDQ